MSNSSAYNFQTHKYKNGHQLIFSSVVLDRLDQDTVDRLSDISGQIRPGELFSPYFTCYPLPSKKYFVMARTWQDLNAPRPGCVITKSLIIPMQQWETLEEISNVFLSLTEPPEEAKNQYLLDTPQLFEPVDNSPTNEIVEALFLEQRKPIVIFDCDAANSIVYKLYSAFWPGMRRDFATCTFALSPRTVNGRSFDLIFARNDLRSRFVEWSGRRIEGMQVSKKPPRHRWTKELADRIFESDNPSILNRTSIAAYQIRGADDESSIRLSLLWEELFRKAEIEGSPFAVLGLLDIINSQKIFEADLYANVQPLIYKAIEVAKTKLSLSDAWKFYAALLVKHKRKLMGREMIYAVRNACRDLTISDPQIGYVFFNENEKSDKLLPAVLYASFADGIAFNKQFITFYLNNVVADIGQLMLATSKEFSNSIMDYYLDNPLTVSVFLNKSINVSKPKYKNAAKANLATFVSNRDQKDIVDLLFTENSVQQYQKLVKIVGRSTSFKIRDFDHAILFETSLLDQQPFLLQSINSFDNKGMAIPLITKILVSQPSLINQFFLESRMPPAKEKAILISVFNELEIESLFDIDLDRDLKRLAVDLLFDEEKGNKVIAGFLLLSAGYKPKDVFSRLNSLSDEVINAIGVDLLEDYIFQTIDKAPKDTLLMVANLISKLNEDNSRTILIHLFNQLKDTESRLKMIDILIKAGAKVQSILAENIDYVSQLFSKTLPTNSQDYIINYWTSLFEISNNHEKKQEAALATLEYAYRFDKSDPFRLLTVAFPIVYNTFLHGRTFTQYISFVFFPDWDRCRTLRHDLVDRYIHSNWSRFGLIEVASQTGISKEIVSILKDSKNGRKIITEALEEAKELEIDVKDQGVKELLKAIKPKKGKRK
jgi:hypothetical protein